jgi:hypothetical protein
MKPTFTLLILFLFIGLGAHAQLNYQPGGFSTNLGTYTDLGTNGTVITVANSDDAFSTAQPIGFTFNFNGFPYDSFVLSTNGFIKLGSDSASRHFLFTAHAQPPPNGVFASGGVTTPAPLASDSSMIFGFGQDLHAGTSNAEFRVFTDGNPGTRVCTIQWKNLKDKLQAGVGGLWDTINFQIKLYEGTNVVEIVYGRWTSTISLAAARFSAVGIVGRSVTVANQNIHLVKGSTVAWGAAVANTGFYINNAVNYRNPTSIPAGPAPDNGRTYRFTPITLNDAAVRFVYAQGRVSLDYNRPDSIRANIFNPGVNALTNLTVSLNITGDHNYTTTATVANLASGANTNVAFAPFTPTITGSSIITVSVPNDDNNANNTQVYSYAVGGYRMAYTDTLQPHTGSNGTTVPNFWGARYFINNTAILTTVRSFLVSNSDAVGDTVCGLILDTLGNILARSANRVVQTSDLGTTLVFHMLLPPRVSNIPVIAGIAGSQSVNGLNYFLGTSQTETPLRPGNVFYFMAGAFGQSPMVSLRPGAFYATPVLWGTTRLMQECEARPIPQVDVLVSAAYPGNNFRVRTGTNINLRAIVRNNGVQARPTGIPVRYQIDNGPLSAAVNTNVSINPDDTTNVLFTGANALTFSTPGTYTVKLFTALANDSIPGNDTLVLTIIAESPTTLPYRIQNNMNSSWTVVNPTTLKTRTVVQANGQSAAGVTWFDHQVAAAGTEASLISPMFNFTGITHPVLHFNVAHAPTTVNTFDDTLEVLVSVDGGYTFNTVYMKNSFNTTSSLGTDTATVLNYTPQFAQDWRMESVSLLPFSGAAQVYVIFRTQSGNGNSVYIGNVNVANALSFSSQPVPFSTAYSHANMSVTFNNIGQAGADINFTRFAGAPFSNASPVFASNASATTNNNSIFTPNLASVAEWHAISYGGTGTSASPLAVTYTLNYDRTGLTGMASTDSVYIMRRNDFSSPWTPVSTIYTFPFFTALNLSGFGEFTLGSVSGVNTLPVNWLTLKVTRKAADLHQLNWVTASETNNHYFEVERSFDGIYFEGVGQVKSAGNSNTIKHYSFVSVGAELAQQAVYYRVKQVDYDGAFTYSEVVSIQPYSIQEVLISNPFEGAPTVWFSSALQDVKVTVYDVTGRNMGSQIITQTNTQQGESITLFNTLHAGTYFVEIQSGSNKITTQKVVKH